MAEQTKDEPKAEAKTETRTAAMAEMLNAAESFRLLQQQAALEALKLPEQRLDDASPDGGAKPYTLRDLGDGEFQKINAFGDEVNERGELTARGRESAQARATAGIG